MSLVMHSYIMQYTELLERWDLQFIFRLLEYLCYLTLQSCRGVRLNTDLEDFHSRRQYKS